MNWKKVKIVSYLCPHPFDEDSEVELDMVSWLPGFVNEPSEEHDDPVYTEVNGKLYRKIEDKVTREFRKALKNMWPLCKDINMKQMNVMIDLMGISGTKRSLAGYLFGRSNPMKGVYQFKLSSGLLMGYLKNKPTKCSVWEHELIHMLDHMETTRSSVYAECDSRTNNLRHFILKFREEGIADLYYLLKGNHPDVHSVEEAKEMFREKVKWAGLKCHAAVRSDDKFRKELYDGYHFYDAGPWLILDYLQDMNVDQLDNVIADSLTALREGTEIPEDRILSIIRLALDFVECGLFIEYARRVMKEKAVSGGDSGGGVASEEATSTN